jgi:hypothetical protein
MPFFNASELSEQKSRLKHRTPIVKQGINVQEDYIADQKKSKLPLIGAAVGLTSLALIGAYAWNAQKSKKQYTYSEPVQEEGFLQGAAKTALPLGAAALLSKKGKKKKVIKKQKIVKPKGGFLTSSSEGEGMGQKLKGAAKKATIAAGVKKMLGSSSEGEVQHQGFSGKIKNKLHMPGFLQSSSEYESEQHPGFVGKMKSHIPAAWMMRRRSTGSMSDTTTSTSTSDNEGMGGKAKSLAKKAAIGYGIKKAVTHNASSSSTTSTTSSYDEGFGQKIKGGAMKAATGWGLSKALGKNKQQKKQKKFW